MKRIFTYITYIFICLLSPALLVQEKASAQSLSLEDCLRMAGENDVRIRNAGLDVIASRAQKSEALSNWFPTVSIDGTGFYAFDPFLKIRLGDVLGDSDYALELNRIAESAGALYGISTSWTALDYGFSARAQLTQLLYAGGRIVNGNRLAALGVEAAMLKESLAVRESS
ncbi:MAG: TolC family protein, partial [Candidatus Cryptobacteroides sp.]